MPDGNSIFFFQQIVLCVGAVVGEMYLPRTIKLIKTTAIDRILFESNRITNFF